MSVIAFSRRIGPVSLDCQMSEKHVSEIEITSNPIETGAEVNDHAYIKPKEVTLEIGSGDAAATYAALVRFQESRVPFMLVTGLSIYNDMLIQSIDATRDKTHSRVLNATVRLRQVIIVSTGSAPADTEAASGGTENQSRSKPGGKNSRGAARPTKESASNPSTADRAASTVQVGDNPTKTVPEARTRSTLHQVFG